MIDDDTLHDPTSSMVGARCTRDLLPVTEIGQRVCASGTGEGVPTYIATGATCNPRSSGQRTSTGIYRLLPRSRSHANWHLHIGLPGASAVVTEVLAATAIRHLPAGRLRADAARPGAAARRDAGVGASSMARTAHQGPVLQCVTPLIAAISSTTICTRIDHWLRRATEYRCGRFGEPTPVGVFRAP